MNRTVPRRRLAAAIAWLLCATALLCQAAPAEPRGPEALYSDYATARGNRQVEVANELMAVLARSGCLDTTYSFTNREATRMASLVHYGMAEYYHGIARYAEALAAAEQAENAARHYKDDLFHSDLMSLAGIVCIRLGRLDQALDCFERCYDIDTRLRDDERVSSDLNSMAAVYLTAKQPEQGIRCIDRAIALERRLGRDDRLAVRLGMAADLYRLKPSLDTALALAGEAYDLDRAAGRSVKAAVRQSQMAAVLIEQDSLDRAERLLLDAVGALDGGGQDNSLSICYGQLAEVSLARGEMAAAERYLRLALPLCQVTGNRYIERKVENGLWRVCRESRPQEALAHLERYSALADSMFTDDTAEQLGRFRVVLRVDELTRERERSLTLATRLAWLAAVLGALLLMAVAAIVWLWRRRVATPAVAAGQDTSAPAAVADERSAGDRAFLAQVTDAVHRNMAEGELNAEALAQAVGMSVRQLRERLTRLTGDGIAAYSLRVRLAHARQMLERTDRPVADVAAKCGFQSAAHFTRAFKQCYAITPTQCRQQAAVDESE